MASHETWYFLPRLVPEICQLNPGDMSVIQILPNSLTMSLPTSGAEDTAPACNSVKFY